MLATNRYTEHVAHNPKNKTRQTKSPNPPKLAVPGARYSHENKYWNAVKQAAPCLATAAPCTSGLCGRPAPCTSVCAQPTALCPHGTRHSHVPTSPVLAAGVSSITTSHRTDGLTD